MLVDSWIGATYAIVLVVVVVVEAMLRLSLSLWWLYNLFAFGRVRTLMVRTRLAWCVCVVDTLKMMLNSRFRCLNT